MNLNNITKIKKSQGIKQCFYSCSVLENETFTKKSKSFIQKMCLFPLSHKSQIPGNNYHFKSKQLLDVTINDRNHLIILNKRLLSGWLCIIIIYCFLSNDVLCLLSVFRHQVRPLYMILEGVRNGEQKKGPNFNMFLNMNVK